ncbi:hypothetical protein QQ73_14535, partial [Candidatus Endoriftia persephone str. Guaymas]|nr:hypothetical protein [Candidatus Endoriftia persephone str. Guaymas]
MPFGSTVDNLKTAVAGETHEYTDMYPGMAKAARDEGFDEIADWFETLAKAERSHANRYQKALNEMEQCCGMPKLELGDLEAVEAAKNANIPVLTRLVDEGWDIVAPVPSCALMFKQELPLMFPDEPDVIKVSKAIFDPFEYLMHRHKAGKLNTDFKTPLGKVAYHAACHQRVQNVGS